MKETYNANIQRVIGVQFGIMGPEEIRRRSVVEVTKREGYNSGDNPVIGGLFDPRMGVLDSKSRCKTDQLDKRDSPGYFGHIELGMPVFYVQFIRFVQMVLGMICWRCSAVLLNPDDSSDQSCIKKIRQMFGYARFMKAHALIKHKFTRQNPEPCHRCNTKQPKYVKEDLQIVAQWSLSKEGKKEDDSTVNRTNRVLMTPEYVTMLFKRLTDEEIELLGFHREHSRPEWMICSVLPVPPPTMRPSVHSDGSQRQEDDLTMKLSDILKCNDMLKTKLGAATDPSNPEQYSKTIESLRFVLQYHVATLIDNECGISQATQRSGRPLKCIKARLKSKDGRVRGNLMGKRVDFSSRSVITPDPILKCDQLGVPLDICRNLTIPERVDPFNIGKLRRYIRNGPTWPGAKKIKRQGGQERFLKYINATQRQEIAESLCIGDVVHRHLQEDDHVLFNRQPSLHKMSMMCHRVMPIRRGKTFRLNVDVTNPYNADFDGDEMNMHVPQSTEAMNELKMLAAVPRQFIAPTAGKPVVMPVQDTMLGVHLLSQDEECFNHRQLMNASLWLSEKAQKKLLLKMNLKTKDTSFTGREVLDACIPAMNINMKDVKISSTHGFTSGDLSKSNFKSKSNGLVYVAFQEKGPYVASDMIDDIRGVVTYYMLQKGFSVGVSDLITSPQQKADMQQVVVDCRAAVDEELMNIHTNGGNTPQTSRGYLDAKLQKNGMEASDKIMATVKEAADEGRYMKMVNAGSKGTELNIQQMMGCLGQQEVDGKLIAYGFENRTLPHYCKYDDSMESRGFVSNSFMDGLTPQEFFFHSMTGREGLIDTAVKTAQTGYIQRRIMKMMEDLSVQHDDTVRNTAGDIIQFRYGEDGFDPTKMEDQTIQFANGCDGKGMSINQIKEAFGVTNSNYNEVVLIDEDTLLHPTATQIHELHKTGLPIVNYFHLLFGGKTCKLSSGAMSHPVNLERLITNAYAHTFARADNLDEKYVIKQLTACFEALQRARDPTTHLFRVLVHSYLGPAPAMRWRLACRHRVTLTDPESKNTAICPICHTTDESVEARKPPFTKQQYDYMIAEIKKQYERSWAEPGEMVGVIAAQSIGEPATQMTLNTFHFAGVGEKSSVIRGVPRLNELLMLSKNQKAPVQKIYLKDVSSEADAVSVKNRLEFSTLRHVTKSTSIYYDPQRTNSDDSWLHEDRSMLRLFRDFSNQITTDAVDKENEAEETESDAESESESESDAEADDAAAEAAAEAKAEVAEAAEAAEVGVSPWVMRIELDRRTMLEKQIRMEDVAAAIHTIHSPEDITCMYTDDNSNNLIMRIKLIPMRGASNDQDSVDVPESMDDYYLLKMLEKSLLTDVSLRGISNLKKITVKRKKESVEEHYENDTIETSEQYRLDADGKNLLDLLGNPLVDSTNTVSNDIHEIYKVLGIEAARKAIVYEILDVINFAADGSTDVRHITLLADLMTYCSWGKDLLAIDRNGIKKTSIGPLAKCSFEETDKQLYQAAVFGDRDPVLGVSSNIMLGQLAPCGTGTVNVLFDEEEYFRLRQECPDRSELWAQLFEKSEAEPTKKEQMAQMDFFDFDCTLEDDA